MIRIEPYDTNLLELYKRSKITRNDLPCPLRRAYAVIAVVHQCMRPMSVMEKDLGRKWEQVPAEIQQPHTTTSYLNYLRTVLLNSIYNTLLKVYTSKVLFPKDIFFVLFIQKTTYDTCNIKVQQCDACKPNQFRLNLKSKLKESKKPTNH